MKTKKILTMTTTKSMKIRHSTLKTTNLILYHNTLWPASNVLKMQLHPPSAISAATASYLVNAPKKTVCLITAQKDKKCANNHSIYLPNATLLNTVTSLRTQRQKIPFLLIGLIH